MATAPAARARRTAASPPGRVRWDRVTRWVLLGVVAVLLLLYVAPLRSYLSSTDRAVAERAHLGDLKAEQADLRRQRDALQGSQAIETEARRAGMVKPGEQPFVVSDLPSGK